MQGQGGLLVSELTDEIKKHFWWHSIDLGNGIVTPGVKTREFHRQEAALIFDRVKLLGQSVLDIGAWNGFYSFEAERRGARRVLATDSFCWTSDEFKGRDTFELARRALHSEVETMTIDAGDVSRDTVGDFDVVLFLGVFYHRYDALDALGSAASVARQVLIVETHLDLHDVDRPAMMFYPPGQKPNGDNTNWWGPNVSCMVELLRAHDFTEIEVSASKDRGLFHAWRSTALRLAPLQAAARWRRLSVPERVVRELKRPFKKLL
jgi:tRNA (mo5U34)-methyltransferase